jgi:hypothetical protein
MRAHRGSSTTDVGGDFRVLADIVIIFFILAWS